MQAFSGELDIRQSPDAELAEIVRRLVAEFAPSRIYLFGSRARHTARPDSDYDLMLVVPGDLPSLGELGRRGSACLRGVALPVELHFCDSARFESWGAVPTSFQHEVRRTGQILYAA